MQEVIVPAPNIIATMTKFPKIPGMANAITDQIFMPDVNYIVTEKFDGSNASVQRTDFGFIMCSRNNIVGIYEQDNPQRQLAGFDFNGFTNFIHNHAENFLRLEVGQIAYGEWLIPHTVKYPVDMYGKFYMFDNNLAVVLGYTYTVPEIDTIFGRGHGDELWEIANEVVADYEKELDRPFEGIVLAPDVNTPVGNLIKVYHPKFKEQHKQAWNPKKVIGDLEVAASGYYPVRAYQKVVEKIEDNLKRKIRMEDTGQVLGRCGHDYFTEYLIDAIKGLHYPVLDTRKLKQAVDNRVKDIFFTQMNTGHMPIWAQQEIKMAELKGKL